MSYLVGYVVLGWLGFVHVYNYPIRYDITEIFEMFSWPLGRTRVVSMNDIPRNGAMERMMDKVIVNLVFDSESSLSKSFVMDSQL